MLAERARAQGQSLQAFLLSMVRDEASRTRNLSLLERFASRSDGSRLTVEELTDAVAQAREEREERLLGGPGREAGGAG